MQKKRLIIGIIIIIVSCGVYLYPSFEKMRFHQEIDSITDIYNNSDMEISMDAPYIENEYDLPYQELYQEMRTYNESLVKGQNLMDCWSYVQNPIQMSNMPSDNDVIGYMVIPDMNLEIPLLIGASTENLGKGAAVLNETSMPIGGENTNCVIAGHRGYKGMPYFRDIEDLDIGSSVYIVNPWETLEYTVTGKKIISPYDSESIEIQKGKDMVTLLTCHPYMSHGKYRYLVFCERVETIESEIGVGATNNEPEIGDKVDIAELTEEKDMSQWIIFTEDTLRVVLPIIGVIIVVLFIIFRKKAVTEKNP